MKGSVVEGFGKLTGDTKTEAEGIVEKLSLKAKKLLKMPLKELSRALKISFIKTANSL